MVRKSIESQVPLRADTGYQALADPFLGGESYLTTYYGNFQMHVRVQPHKDAQAPRTAQEAPSLGSGFRPPLPAHGDALRQTGKERASSQPNPEEAGSRSLGKEAGKEEVLGRREPEVQEAQG